MSKQPKLKKEWSIYIPEEGHWPINVSSNATKAEARKAYLKWANRRRLPAGSFITDCAEWPSIFKSKKR